MAAASRKEVGLVLGSHVAPEHIYDMARRGEEGGFDDIWLAEDWWFTGGIAGAGAALSATQRVPVGTGVVTAMVRHPALLAIETATLACIYPGRFRLGIGFGFPAWVKALGLYPPSPLQTMRELVTSMRALLAGDVVDVRDVGFVLDKTKLAFPPPQPVPIYMGSLAPKMLQLAGEVADGVVLSVGATERYVRWAREQVETGRARGSANRPFHTVLFVLFSVSDDAQVAREGTRQMLSFMFGHMPKSPLSDVNGMTSRLEELAAGGLEAVAKGLSDEWIDDLTVSGTPRDCAAKITRLFDAGVDTVALFPQPSDRIEETVEMAMTNVLPLVREAMRERAPKEVT